jgi:hypothetical protein
MTPTTRRPRAPLLVGALLFAAQPAFATFAPSLNLVPGDPDLQVNNLQAVYDTTNNGATGTLTLENGFGGAGNAPGSVLSGGSTVGSFNSLTYSGVLNLSNGALDTGSSNFFTITDTAPANDVILLDGTIFDFGVDPLSDTTGTFEMLVDLTTVDPSLQAFGFSADNDLSVIFNATNTNLAAGTGTMAAGWEEADFSFRTGDSSTSDNTAPAPAPGAVVLLGTGLVALRMVRRRRWLD